jgi:hypothetical protein
VKDLCRNLGEFVLEFIDSKSHGGRKINYNENLYNQLKVNFEKSHGEKEKKWKTIVGYLPG